MAKTLLSLSLFNELRNINHHYYRDQSGTGRPRRHTGSMDMAKLFLREERFDWGYRKR
jgi:hypothetical protein